MSHKKGADKRAIAARPQKAHSSIRFRAPSASSHKVREMMQALTGVETRPEKLLRSHLHRLGLRFRKDCRPLPDHRITADAVFPSQRVCVFVDGCFWHGCPTHFRPPKSNTSWWREKIADNRSRDTRQNDLLRKKGWLVLRYWEHDIVGPHLSAICQEIVSAVKERRGSRRNEATSERERQPAVSR